jgi:hypothetical protein
MNREEWQQLAWQELLKSNDPWAAVTNNACRELPRVVIKTSIMDRAWFASKKEFEIHAPYVARIDSIIENQAYQYQAGLLFQQFGFYWVVAQPSVSLDESGKGRFLCVFHLHTGILITAVHQEKRAVLDDDHVVLRSRSALSRCFDDPGRRRIITKDVSEIRRWRNPSIRVCLEDASLLIRELDKQ